MEPLTASDPRTVGEFTLRARLGAGGMGQVYLGFSQAGRAVAIKVVHAGLLNDREFRERFGREVAAARAVSGMYTAPVVASGLDDNPPWLATAFVPGPSLADVVSEQGALPEAALWRLAAGLTEALRAVHACGLVHRDLKPANVLLAADGPHVIDFGISRAFEGTSLTQTGTVVGTPGYMSPEQAEGRQVGPQSDVFSLGCVLAYAATGSPPFGTGSAASVLFRVVTADPDLGAVPPGLRPVLEACLKKNPAERTSLAALGSMISASGPATVATLGAFWPEPLNSAIAAVQAYPAPAQAGPQPAGSATAGAAAAQAAAPAAAGPGGMVTDGYLHAATRSMIARNPPRAQQASGAPQPAASRRQQPTAEYGMPGGPYAPWPGGAAQPATAWQQRPTPGSVPQAGPYGVADPLAQYTPGLRRPATAEVPGPVLTAVRLMWTGLVFSALELVFAATAVGRYTQTVNTTRTKIAPLARASLLYKAGSKVIRDTQAWSTVVGTFGLTSSIIALVLWTLLAVSCRSGRGWARVTGTVLFGVNTIGTLALLFGSFGDPAVKAFAGIVWAIGLSATILLWGSQASAFFTAWRKPRPHRA